MADEDAELEELRRQKLLEMQKMQADKSRNTEMLSQLRKGVQIFLAPEAADRLDRLRMTKPEKVARAEMHILQNLVRAGKISQERKLADEELKLILKQMEPQKREPTIRRA